MKGQAHVWYSLFVTFLVIMAAFMFVINPAPITGFVTGANITTANVTTTATVNNLAPTVTSVIDSIIQPAAGNTFSVFCNVTATDSNGGSDITAINATLFEIASGESSSVNNYTSFINSSCGLNTPNGNVRTANCTFRVPYYMRTSANAAWMCRGMAIDSGNNQVNGSTTFTVGDCVGVFINPGDAQGTTLAFGSIAPGASSGNQSLNVSNYCNTQIDLLTQGINMTSGANTILIRNVSYSFSPWNVATFLNVTHVGDNVAPAGDFNASYDLVAQTSATMSNRTMWFNLSVPSGQPSGSYIGALNFTVQKG